MQNNRRPVLLIVLASLDRYIKNSNLSRARLVDVSLLQQNEVVCSRLNLHCFEGKISIILKENPIKNNKKNDSFYLFFSLPSPASSSCCRFELWKNQSKCSGLSAKLPALDQCLPIDWVSNISGRATHQNEHSRYAVHDEFIQSLQSGHKTNHE